LGAPLLPPGDGFVKEERRAELRSGGPGEMRRFLSGVGGVPDRAEGEGVACVGEKVRLRLNTPEGCGHGWANLS
jgi:hypothetical protein